VARMRSEERLDRAMEIFWVKGYYDTSVDDLMSRTGLHRAAMYGQFGSKRGLFEAALRRYRETVIARFFVLLAGPDAARAEIDRFFREIYRVSCAEKRHGCLMINTASEVSPQIKSVARIVMRYLDDLRALLRRACVNARRRGEIRPETDVDQVADYLVGSVLGLWSLGRSPAPATTLRHYVDGVLGFLDGLRPKARGHHSLASRATRA